MRGQGTLAYSLGELQVHGWRSIRRLASMTDEISYGRQGDEMAGIKKQPTKESLASCRVSVQGSILSWVSVTNSGGSVS